MVANNDRYNANKKDDEIRFSENENRRMCKFFLRFVLTFIHKFNLAKIIDIIKEF